MARRANRGSHNSVPKAPCLRPGAASIVRRSVTRADAWASVPKLAGGTHGLSETLLRPGIEIMLAAVTFGHLAAVVGITDSSCGVLGAYLLLTSD